jgi:hypothetical protein
VAIDIQQADFIGATYNMDYHLKFTDEAQAKSILYRKEGVVEAGEGIEANEGYDVANFDNIDVIGIIYKPTGLSDSEGNPILVDLEGWHVNVRHEGEVELDEYVVYPTQPIRKWAGDK